MGRQGNIFAHQGAADLAIYNLNSQPAADLAYTSAGVKIPYDAEGADKSGAYVADKAIWYQDTRICSVSDVALLGRHNLQNVCAAVAAAWQVSQEVPSIATAIQNFQGLPYRLQDLGVVSGIRYINDSFGVQPDAAMAAIQSFEESKVLILGGVDRNLSYADLADAVGKSNVRGVVLIGETAQQIQSELQIRNVVCEIVEGDMKTIVQHATDMAQPGDVVILSPACASFDMFKDYIDRGNQFNAAVKELQ